MLLTEFQNGLGTNITVEVAMQIGEGKASINHGGSAK